MFIILGPEDVQVIRFSVGSRTLANKGRYTDEQEEPFAIEASVQPAGYTVLQTLSEGERQRDPRILFTEDERVADLSCSSPFPTPSSFSSSASPIRTGSQHDQHRADQVRIDGALYEVRQVKEYREGHPIPHFEVIVLRVKE